MIGLSFWAMVGSACLSPRGRGNRQPPVLATSPDSGSIPAWAGEPIAGRLPRPTMKGLSPRGRGNRSHTCRQSSYRFQVYPRVGGGTVSMAYHFPQAPFPGEGLSPRGRGNPHLANTGRHILSPPSLVVLNQVHPVGVDYLFRRFAQRPYLLFAYRGGVAPRHHD